MDKDIADYVTYCDSDYSFDVNEITDLEDDLNQDWIDQSDTSNNQAVWENEVSVECNDFLTSLVEYLWNLLLHSWLRRWGE